MIFFYIVFLIYFFLAIIIICGTYKFTDAKNQKLNDISRSSSDIKKTVSIIVPVRNESKNIIQCLDSLFLQTYPSELYEIVIVDDRSTDGTGNIVKEYYSAKKNDSSKAVSDMKFITITEEPKGFTGKQNALIKGINFAKGEIILNTDADCRVLPTWIEKMVSDFENDTGLVGGFTLTTFRKDASNLLGFNKDSVKFKFFDWIQSLDLLFLETIASGCAGLGFPLSCIGNNVAYRNQAYKEIGGFEKIGFTVTEDTALVQAISSNKNWKIRFSCGKESVAFTNSIATISDFFIQRKRWLFGGYKTKIPLLFMLIITFLVHISTPILFFLSLYVLIFDSYLNAIKCFIPIIIMLLSNFLIIFRGSIIIDRMDLLKYTLPYNVFFIFYTLVLGTLALIGKKEVLWKGRTYR